MAFRCLLFIMLIMVYRLRHRAKTNEQIIKMLGERWPFATYCLPWQVLLNSVRTYVVYPCWTSNISLEDLLEDLSYAHTCSKSCHLIRSVGSQWRVALDMAKTWQDITDDLHKYAERLQQELVSKYTPWLKQAPSS